MPAVHRNPIPDNQWGQWIIGAEQRLDDLISRSNAVDEALRDLGEDASANKVRTTFAQVSARLFMMRSNYNEIRFADALDLLGERAADAVAMDCHSSVKTAWRAAYIGALPLIPFHQLRRLRTVLDEAGTEFDRLSGRFGNEVGGNVADALREDMDAISQAIFDLAENCTTELDDDDSERLHADGILLDVYSGDMTGYVDEIAAIAKRHQEYKAKKVHARSRAEAFMDAVAATGHSVAVVRAGEAVRIAWVYPEDYPTDQPPDLAAFAELKEKFRDMSDDEKEEIVAAVRDRTLFGRRDVETVTADDEAVAEQTPLAA